MQNKIISLLSSIAAIILGIYLSMTTNRIFYGLILVGVLYGIYSIYLIATHKQKTLEQEKVQKKLAEQEAFSSMPPVKADDEAKDTDRAGGSTETATIIVHWFKEKMGEGSMPVTVNGVDAGTIKKNNLQVTYHTNVPFNVITMGIYKTEIELSPGDTVEYFVAGNGIRHNRTIITRR